MATIDLESFHYWKWEAKESIICGALANCTQFAGTGIDVKTMLIVRAAAFEYMLAVYSVLDVHKWALSWGTGSEGMQIHAKKRTYQPPN